MQFQEGRAMDLIVSHTIPGKDEKIQARETQIEQETNDDRVIEAFRRQSRPVDDEPTEEE
jgi:hypothetical protein